MLSESVVRCDDWERREKGRDRRDKQSPVGFEEEQARTGGGRTRYQSFASQDKVETRSVLR